MYTMSNSIAWDGANTLAGMSAFPTEEDTRELEMPALHYSFFLDIITPEGKRKRVPLQGSTIVIGRSPKRCELLIEDPRVSRVHVRIHRDVDRGVTITDLFSANGTLFEGHEMEAGVPISWLINQTAVIGSTQLTLRYGQLEND
jgi:hypothetical protein